MLLNSKTINQQILQKASKFFSVTFLQQGLALLNLGSVSISFKKGSMDRFLIATGICNDKSTFEAKIIYKQRLEEVTDESPLSTSCDCSFWSEQKHCSHTAALFLLSLLDEASDHDQHDSYQHSGTDEHRPPSHLGVGVSSFGTIIKSPSKLINSSPKATYTTLNYCLINGTSTQMSSPYPFEGKLVLSLESTDLLDFKYKIKFLDKNNKLNEKISIFEKLYLFDWQTGKSYNLPNILKVCIEKLEKQRNYTIDLFLSYFQLPKFSNLIDIEINGHIINFSNTNLVIPQLIINPSLDKNNFLSVLISLKDENGESVRTPDLFRLLSFDSEIGLLNGFKIKSDGTNFLEKIIVSIESNSNVNISPINNHPFKNLFENLLEVLQDSDYIFYHLNDSNIGKLETKKFLDFLVQLEITWGKTIIKTIESSIEGLQFHINKNLFYDHIREFKLFFDNNDNLPILFKETNIGQWNQNISFTREKSTRNWFDLSLNFEDQDLQIIQNANLERGISEINGQIYVLNDDQIKLAQFLKRYISTAHTAIKNDQKKNAFLIPFTRARIFELLELKKLGIIGELFPEEQAIIDYLSNLESIPQAPISLKEKNFLRPYQVQGVNWLHFLYQQRFGACLADDMGLGKTLQVISFISSIYQPDKKYLIICPVSILYNWKKEFEKFSELSVSIYHGPERNSMPQSNIILTSYGIIKREFQSDFFKQEFEVIAMDEVQNLKNIRSIGSLAVRSIKSNFKVCLTGTPVENDISEFFNILDLSVPGIWGDFSTIKKNKSLRSKEIVRKSSKPFILRRTKDQVLNDLPDKIEQNQFLEFDENEKKFYEQLLVTIQNEIRVTPKNNRFGIILRGILRLRQSCLWQPSIANENNEKYLSTKIEFLCGQIEQILEEGHQALIFSQFTSYLDLIQQVFDQRQWNYSRIDGKYSVTQREKEINQFQNGENKLFLISLKAGGVGLNLTAASYVFIMDPWWNPAVENQAIDRAHRIGQQNKVTVYRPIIEGSVEEKILQLQDEKKKLFEDLLGQSDGEFFSGKLTKEDFEFILDTNLD